MSATFEGVDLASRRLGGMVLAANDEWFAEKENLLNAHPAEWRADAYTARGKWMDGWETRRRRDFGTERGQAHDWAILRLGCPGRVRRVVVDTAFFTGNYPEQCQLEGAALPGYPAAANVIAHPDWEVLAPRSPLQGNTRNAFDVDLPWWLTHLRLRIYPDGGVARLRVFGDPLPDLRGDEPDLAAMLLGAEVVGCSDEFYGSANRMLQPGDALNMGDGWENRRRRDDGHDWAIIRLGAAGTLRRAVVDTRHFLGNCPGAFQLAGSDTPDGPWRPLLPRTPLQPHQVHQFPVEDNGPVRFVRFDIFPDGGIARLRLFGHVDDEERARIGVARVDGMTPAMARARLKDCCGADAWVAQMLQRRPFGTADALLDAADTVWASMGRDDILQAFATHPRIGAGARDGDQSAHGASWSSGEQSGVTGSEVLDDLAQLNARYLDRFGYIYIVCATGRTGTELRDILKTRLGHDPDVELPIAAEEQRLITRIRLNKLIAGVV